MDVIKGTIFLATSLLSPLAFAQVSSSQCSADQLRFEKALQERPAFQIPGAPEGLTATCVQHSMKMFENWVASLGRNRKNAAKIYANCPSEAAQFERITKGPCRTREYVARLVEDYNVVTDCLGLPAKQFYPFVSVESGFMQNALAMGEDVGLGQLTPPAVADVNTHWSTLVARVESSDRSSCRAIAPLLPQLKVEMKNGAMPVCAFVASPANPLRNLLYSAFFFQLNQSYFQKAFETEGISDQIETLAKRRFDERQKAVLAQSLSMISYNLGFEAIIPELRAYLSVFQKSVNALRADLVKSRDQVLELETRLEQKGLSLQELRKLRAELSEARTRLAKQQVRWREAVLNPNDLDFSSKDPSSFASFLRSRGSARYLDLILGNIQRTEKTFGPGVCTDRSLFESLFDPIRWRHQRGSPLSRL